MTIPSQRKYDELHAERLEKYQRQVRKSYVAAIKEVSKLSVGLSTNPNDEFYFRNNPEVSKKVDKVLKQLYTDVYGTSVEGINSEWDLAVEKNNEMAQYVFGNNVENLPASYRSKIFSNNAKARQNFVNRKVNGLGLSDRVWNNTRQFKSNLELALEVGIGNGNSAATMASNITEYLNDPEKLFRRIRDKESGVLRLSKAAQSYNPGQGRYRSSYKNALRLASNEINFSYEGSQTEKRKQQDFIVGVKIKVSPSHNTDDDKGGICCSCLQGNYPKDFDFTYKWHVNCKCTSFNILKTRDELDSDTDKILAGEEPNTPSKNSVSGLPPAYNTYLSDNQKTYANWKTPPRTFAVNKDLPKQIIPTKKKAPAFNLAEYEKGFIDYNTEYDKIYKATGASAKAQLPARTAYFKVDTAVNSYLYENKGIDQSLRAYTGTGYKNIRSYNTTGKISPDSRTPLSVYKEDVINISKFIDDNPIQEDLKVYRRVKGEAMENIFKNLKKGDIFTDKSYMSTSTIPQTSFGTYQLDIYAKAGSKIANANNVSELEYIIQKGAKFKVLKKGDSKITLQLL